MATLVGTSGDDAVIGTLRHDTTNGGARFGTLFGGVGIDTLRPGSGNDPADCSEASAGVTVNLATGFGAGSDAAGNVLLRIGTVVGSGCAESLMAMPVRLAVLRPMAPSNGSRNAPLGRFMQQIRLNDFLSACAEGN